MQRASGERDRWICDGASLWLTDSRNSPTRAGSLARCLAQSSLSQSAAQTLVFCDMKTLYLRNVPDEVGEQLERLAAREGMSVSAFATRELAMIARREGNPALLADLPDLGVEAAAVVGDVEAGRSER